MARGEDPDIPKGKVLMLVVYNRNWVKKLKKLISKNFNFGICLLCFSISSFAENPKRVKR